MVTSQQESFSPVGNITWDVEEDIQEEVFTPVGSITWDDDSEPTTPEKKEARGIRNNNPGNIRKSADVWEGTAEEQTDDEFVSFESPEMGIRAMAKILDTYKTKHQADTVEEILARWAPPEENDTESYIESVVQQTKIPRDSVVDDKKIPSLIKAIIKHENGKVPYSDKVILSGVKKAKTSEYSGMADGIYRDKETGEKFQVKDGERL